MTEQTTYAIKSYSTDRMRSNALDALMDWYGVSSLMYIPESAALQFLEMLEEGEIKL